MMHTVTCLFQESLWLGKKNQGSGLSWMRPADGRLEAAKVN